VKRAFTIKKERASSKDVALPWILPVEMIELLKVIDGTLYPPI